MPTISRYAPHRAHVVAPETASDAMWVTYRWMTLGLALTGLVAFGIAQSPSLIARIADNPVLFYGVLIAQLVMVFAFNSVASRASTPVTAAMFFLYAALNGVTFSVLFLLYTATSIAATFFVTAGAFAGLAAFGTLTKIDLSPIGRFGLFAVIGVVLAMVVNIFLRNPMLDLVISIVGVVLFAGLTAYDTQRLRRMFEQEGAHANLALVGALTLYLDFVNMFLFMLRLFGGSRSNG